MGRVSITQEIRVHEIDSLEAQGGALMVITSHWHVSDFVVISIGGKCYTVDGDDLRIAAGNAMNTGEEL